MKRRETAVRLMLMVIFGVIAAHTQRQTAPGPFTAAQADAGRRLYLAHCASCHLPDLAGRNEAAELAGSNFIRAWERRTTSDLLNLHSNSHATGQSRKSGRRKLPQPGCVPSPGQRCAGEQPVSVRGGSCANRLDSDRAACLRICEHSSRAATADIPGGVQQVSRPMGLLVAGQVRNYVPVTDEMLRNPDPGDWLMIRRNYQAHSYSPLDSITTRNVEGSASRVGLGDERWAGPTSPRRSYTTASSISRIRATRYRLSMAGPAI